MLLKEVRRYLTVGAGGLVIDAGLFNLLLSRLGDDLFLFAPIFYKIFSTSLAITFTYFVNSRWTFSDRTGREPGLRRAIYYFIVNLAGISITVMPLWFSRYVLGFDSLISDNISANVIGAALAFLFRFTISRKWVFLA